MFDRVLKRCAAPSEPGGGDIGNAAAFAGAGKAGMADTRRRYRRWSVNLSGNVLVDDEPRFCAIYDISPGGARVQVAEGDEVAIGRQVMLEVDGFGEIPAEVRHSAHGFLGLRFTYEPEEEVEFARHLVASRPPRRRERQAVSNAATLRLAGAEMPCVIVNISRTGAAVTLDETRHFVAGDEVWLRLAGGASLAALVRYVDGNAVGLRLIDEYRAD